MLRPARKAIDMLRGQFAVAKANLIVGKGMEALAEVWQGQPPVAPCRDPRPRTMNENNRLAASYFMIIGHDLTRANRLSNLWHLLPGAHRQYPPLIYRIASFPPYEAGVKTLACWSASAGDSTTGVPYVLKLGGKAPPQYTPRPRSFLRQITGSQSGAKIR